MMAQMVLVEMSRHFSTPQTYAFSHRKQFNPTVEATREK